MTKAVLRSLARRWQARQAEIDDLDGNLTPLVTAVAPELIALPTGTDYTAAATAMPTAPVAHCAGPDALPPATQGLHRQAHRRGQDQERDPALPQALHRP